MFWKQFCGVVVSSVLCVGCASDLAVRSTPPGAQVTVDGAPVGETPTKTALDFGKKTYYEVAVSKVGYIPASQTVTSGSTFAQRGWLDFTLVPDQAFGETTISDAANKWQRIQINTEFTKDSAWQRIVDAVTSHYASLEQMDQASGYIQSRAMTRVYKTPGKGEFSVRTHFVASIAQSSPLTYKVKIVSERSDTAGSWVPYDRIFTDDQQLIEQLQERLGIK